MGYAQAAMAIIGGLAGGQKDSTSQVAEGSTTKGIRLQNFDDLNQGRSGLEADTYNSQVSNFGDLQRLLGLGPGDKEVSANNQFQNSYADQLKGLLSGLSNPNQQANYNEAQKYFAPQQEALNQQFKDANVDSNRLSARLGRAGNDPILRNKLMQEQTRQQSSLNAQVGAFGQQLPMFKADQIMGIGDKLSNIRSGLATQAFANRQALLGMGQQLTQAERQYRMGTAQQYGSQYQTGEQFSGGGFKGAVSGAFAGAGAGGGMGGGGGG